MRGRNSVAVLVLLLVAVLGAIVWLNRNDGGKAAFDGGITATKPTGFPAPEPPEVASANAVLDGGPVQKAIHDRQLRDEMRRRILAAWAQGAPDETTRAAAREGRFEPIPDDPDASRAYLQDVVRNDFVPLAKQCYEQLLERKKKAGGRVEFSFKIVGDEKIGGVIDDAEVTAEGGVDDPELITCMRESFLSLTFRPPPKGSITVRYPIVLAPGDDDEEKKK
jgi:hypothetical protein